MSLLRLKKLLILITVSGVLIIIIQIPHQSTIEEPSQQRQQQHEQCFSANVVRPRPDDIHRQNKVWQVQEIHDDYAQADPDELIVHSSSVYFDQRPLTTTVNGKTTSFGVVRFNGFRPSQFISTRDLYCQLWYEEFDEDGERNVDKQTRQSTFSNPLIAQVNW